MTQLTYMGARDEVGLRMRLQWAARVAFVPLIVLCITLAAFAICLLVPALPVGRNTEDFIAVLEGARRIAQGLRPHVDFPLPHGPMPLYQAVFPYLFRYDAASFLLYQWMGWLLVLPALVPIAKAQPTLLRALFVIAFVALSTLIPMIVEYDNGPEISYHASYNRLTAALLCLLLVWIFSPRHRGWGQALLIGYVLALLAATKVTGFVGAGVMLAIFAVLSAPARVTVLRAFALLLAIFIVAQVLTGIPKAYLNDIQMMLSLNKGGMAYAATATAARNIVVVAATFAVIISVMPRYRTEARDSSRPLMKRLPAIGRSWRAVLLLAAALCMIILVESQNTGSIGLAAIAAVVVGSLPRARSSAMFRSAALAALCVAAVGPWISSITFRGMNIIGRQMPDLVAVPAVAQLLPRTGVPRAVSALADDYMQIWQATLRSESPVTLSKAWIDAGERNQHAMFVARALLVGEAAEAAIRAGLINPHVHVFTAGETELFAPLLGSPPLRGINTWHNDRSSLRMSNDRLREYLAGVDLAFRTRCGLPTAQAKEAEIFAQALAPDFDMILLTPCWEAWRRRIRAAT